MDLAAGIVFCIRDGLIRRVLHFWPSSFAWPVPMAAQRSQSTRLVFIEHDKNQYHRPPGHAGSTSVNADSSLSHARPQSRDFAGLVRHRAHPAFQGQPRRQARRRPGLLLGGRRGEISPDADTAVPPASGDAAEPAFQSKPQLKLRWQPSHSTPPLVIATCARGNRFVALSGCKPGTQTMRGAWPSAATASWLPGAWPVAT